MSKKEKDSRVRTLITLTEADIEALGHLRPILLPEASYQNIFKLILHDTYQKMLLNDQRYGKNRLQRLEQHDTLKSALPKLTLALEQLNETQLSDLFLAEGILPADAPSENNPKLTIQHRIFADEGDFWYYEIHRDLAKKPDNENISYMTRIETTTDIIRALHKKNYDFTALLANAEAISANK